MHLRASVCRGPDLRPLHPPFGLEPVVLRVLLEQPVDEGAAVAEHDEDAALQLERSVAVHAPSKNSLVGPRVK